MQDGIDIHETAGLFDDAVDGGEPEPRPLPYFFGREERIENLAEDRFRNAGAGIADFHQHIVGRRHALGIVALALLGRDIGRAQLQAAAVRHGVARIDREIHDHLLELRDIGLDRPQIAPVHHIERDFLADQPP